MIYNINGVPSDTPHPGSQYYFTANNSEVLKLNVDDHSSDIEVICVYLQDQIAATLFSTYCSFIRYSASIPDELLKHFQETGLNSESSYSATDFTKAMDECEGENTFRLLYLYECRSLVSAIQEIVKEVSVLLGDFYLHLNCDVLFPGDAHLPDGLRHSQSETTMRIVSHLNYLFIRMSSVLDYCAKLVYEIENLPKSFDQRQKLLSRKILYGDYSRFRTFCPQNNGNTVFEKCNLIEEVQSARNHVIHNGFLDELPKVYELRQSGAIAAKWVYFPDMMHSENGQRHFVSAYGRGLFYSEDSLISMKLPAMVLEFNQRLVNTLEIIASSFPESQSLPQLLQQFRGNSLAYMTARLKIVEDCLNSPSL